MEDPQWIQSLEAVEIVEMACGDNHSLLVSNVGEVYTFGNGKYGQLGHGDTESRSVPKHVEALKGQHVIKVKNSYNSTLV